MVAPIRQSRAADASRALYTPDQRARRDATVWTRVQGVLAIFQFAVFLVSLALVLRWALTGEGYAAATVSIVVKSGVLAAIMVTGSIWEKVVFDRWLLAPAFFWEDMVSFVVIALHGAYVAALLGGWLSPQGLIALALAAYAAYALNAAQFVMKLRAARLQGAAGVSA
ncbi:MAG: 2-vinyl bacteriochlorophyllide hydratase [Albimonas sp.]|uniref:2-vinyl bacteriochlorophyllide hydratase n=1 Tax=Albimonas sp. TaxID=1872425 RepID=UPI004056A16B